MPKSKFVIIPKFMAKIDTFSIHLTISHGIKWRSVTLGNQKDVSGVRGSHPERLDRRIVLERMGIADFNMRKCGFSGHLKINMVTF